VFFSVNSNLSKNNFKSQLVHMLMPLNEVFSQLRSSAEDPSNSTNEK